VLVKIASSFKLEHKLHKFIELLTHLHSNPGYSSAYTTALTYTYGFPQDQPSRIEMEEEIVVESQARVQGDIDGYEGQMSGGH
jgi:hypothetical protein